MSILDNEIVRTVSIRSARTLYFGGSDVMANFLGPLLGEYGELYIDPRGFVAPKLKLGMRFEANKGRRDLLSVFFTMLATISDAYQ